MIREVNNTFKNLLRAKGYQSIYKHMGRGQQDIRVWGSALGFHPGPARPEAGVEANASHQDCPASHRVGSGTIGQAWGSV